MSQHYVQPHSQVPRSKFKKLKNDPTLLREGQLQRFLRNLKKNNEIDNIIYDKIYPSGSQPARIYGLPKMHKVQDHSSTPPFRSIVSSIGTYNYNLAKYLCTLLNPHIPNDYCAQDTFTFVSEVTRLHTHTKFMVSFDVESLFTNIPLVESINLAVDYIMQGNPDIKLGRENLTKLFLFATAQTHFSFLDNFYDQIDGVAMGSPLAPVLANLFMGHHEKRWLENYNSGIEFYRRYVDDTFALFNTEQDALSFFSYINSQHPNIKFTMEREENQKLPFLDVLLDNHSNQGIITSVFHKKTYTGLLTNYCSFVPFSYKLGLVRTLVDRIFKINNTWAGFHLDVNNLTKTLRKNSFPSSVIENVVRKFLNNHFTPDSSQSGARKDNCLYFKLPYIGPFSIITQRRIRKLVNTLCSDLEIKLVFTPFKIKSWFGAKDPIPAGLRSRVIYKFSCAGCSACYIGETNRHFATRIREHLASDKNSHIFKHLRGSENCRSLCSEDCFKILDSAPTSFQLKIKEAMHILWEQPSLNSQVKHLNLSGLLY